MSKFKPGDLVVVVNKINGEPLHATGMVGTIRSECDSCECGITSSILTGLSFYQVNGLPGFCYRENVLKKIDGDRPAVTTKTEETHDQPVEA